MRPDCKLRNATAKIALCCFARTLYDTNRAQMSTVFRTHEPGNRQNEILKQCLAWLRMSCSRRLPIVTPQQP